MYSLFSSIKYSSMEHTIVTLWGDFAENDGSLLEKLKEDRPILALCDFWSPSIKVCDRLLYVFIAKELSVVV